jgi:transcription initiation factor IIE alpha subunit
MLLAIQNLIEYLNRNYFNDERIEEEVITMTKTLYDPEVEKRKAMEIAKNLMDILDDETIALKTGLSLEEVKKIREKLNSN